MSLRSWWAMIKLGLFLGATVFGGVSVAYPVIRQRASELGPITPEDVDGLYALAVFLPAPSFMNLWGAVCMRAGGLPAAAVGLLALLVPSILLVLLLPLLGRISWIAAHGAGVSQGLTWAMVGLLLGHVVEQIQKWKRGHAAHAWGVLLVGFALQLAGVHQVLVLMMAMAYGSLVAVRQVSRKAVM